MNNISIAIVEDIPEIREGLKALISDTEFLFCAGTFSTAEEALAGLPGLEPDIVIMDISLGGMTGVECIRRIRSDRKNKMQFMIFTVFEDSDQVFEAMIAGANGYLLKNSASEKIIEALHELYAGGAPMSTSIARKVVQSFHKTDDAFGLTPRETDVLSLLGKGFLYKEIAVKLGIAIGTVRQHIHSIYEKLHVQNKTEALNKIAGRK